MFSFWTLIMSRPKWWDVPCEEDVPRCPGCGWPLFNSPGGKAKYCQTCFAHAIDLVIHMIPWALGLFFLGVLAGALLRLLF